MRKVNRSLLVIAAFAALVGCAKVPQVEVDAARQALSGAREAEASDYAPDALRAAQDALAKLDAELKVQEEKFALFRSYKVSTELANTAKAEGEKAKQAAAQGKERTKQEVEALLAETRQMLTETQDMLASAPTGKGTQMDKAALQSDLTGVETSLSEVDAVFASGRYKEAKTKAEAAKRSAEAVRMDIQSALEQAKAARTRRS
jgi:hypothetical protein